MAKHLLRQGGGCDGSTLQINACFASGLKRVETELNLNYDKAMRALSAPDEPGVPRSKWRTELRETQRAWIMFRQKNCDALYELSAGGSIRTMRYLTCMARHTEARAKELQEEYLRE